MKFWAMLLVAAGLVVLALSPALAGDFKVIANSSVTADAISPEVLRNIFLQGQSSLEGHLHVVPVLQKSGPIHEAFLKEVLHQNDATLQNYYRALVFTGKGSMPKELDSDAAVLAYVTRTKGAIGYVSDTTDSPGVHTLAIAGAGDGDERRLLTRVEPQYPETLLKLQIGGTVRLKVTIAPKGNVERVELLGGNPILAESAIAAVKQWTYSARGSSSTAEVSVPFDPRR